MKRLQMLALLLLCAVLTGCVKYRITLNNGDHFTVLGKPKYDKENAVYHYKSGGKEQTISAGRVVSVEPDSDAETWEAPATDEGGWFK